MCQARKLSSHVYVCKRYQFCLFLQFFYWILELFWQCGIFLLDFGTVLTVWYFRTVLTVWYFRTVLTVWYFLFSYFISRMFAEVIYHVNQAIQSKRFTLVQVSTYTWLIRWENNILYITPPHVCACPKPGPEFPTSDVEVFFSVQWAKVTGNCLFCWCQWNCWPSLFISCLLSLTLPQSNTWDEFIIFRTRHITNIYFFI
jgi:hypothetical protein